MRCIMKETDSILLVEDDQLDQKSVKRALKDLMVLNPLNIVESGIQAIDFLENKQQKNPCLILLDLNMPQMNGIEFLKIYNNKFRQDVAAPVVVLTTSEEESDIVESYQLGVAGYMLKPVDYKRFIETMRTIHLYWHLSLTPGYTTNEKK